MRVSTQNKMPHNAITSRPIELVVLRGCYPVRLRNTYLYPVILGSSEVGSCITDSGGWESYMDDEDGGTIADQVTRFVSRFVDRVGTEAGISQEHLKSLYTMIPGECSQLFRSSQ